MNSFFVISIAYPSSSTSAYTVLQPMSEISVPGSVEKASSSWRKFIHPSTETLEFKSTTMLLPTASTSNEILTVLEPAALSEYSDADAEAFFHFLDELEAGAYAADDVTTE